MRTTDQSYYLNRRQLLARALKLGLVGTSGLTVAHSYARDQLQITRKTSALAYNNYYEFSTNKESVKHLAQALTLQPWHIRVEGKVERPQQFSITDLLKLGSEERVYRFRCVEGWSMVLPWTGIPLARLLDIVRPQSDARFVQFSALHRPNEMIGQRRANFPWPYTEGLRLDEALHPLTLLATGLYGEPLAKQNGAPVRLVVPWKYGFKSIKAIVNIKLTEDQPLGSWSKLSPEEYGFYANVNPRVAHPRWSQRRELPLGEFKKIKTLPFNGYEKDVATLYQGMDLETHF